MTDETRAAYVLSTNFEGWAVYEKREIREGR
jgi:hypothetical protein